MLSKEKGLLIIMSAPAGAGKTTLVKKLIEEFPKKIVQSISCTTRKPRKGEVDGRDYIFLTENAFEQRKRNGDFLEHVTLFGQQYGTLAEVIGYQRQAGKHVVLVIDTQGALELKKKIEALFIFILPLSLEVLKERLVKRKTESEEAIKKRLSWAEYELTQSEHYHYQIINDDLSAAYNRLKNIIILEEKKWDKSS